MAVIEETVRLNLLNLTVEEASEQVQTAIEAAKQKGRSIRETDIAEILDLLSHPNITGFKAGKMAKEILQDIMKSTKIDDKPVRKLPVFLSAGLPPEHWIPIVGSVVQAQSTP